MIRPSSDGASSDGVPPPKNMVSASIDGSAARLMSVTSAST